MRFRGTQNGTAAFRLCASVSVVAALLAGMDDPPRRFVGVTVPSESLQIGAAQSGIIERMAVTEGQFVKKGDLLFRLTTHREELEVARLLVESQSDTEVREAKARLVQAEREETRYIDLHRRDIAGDAELDTRKREAEVARIRLDRATVMHRVAVLRHKEAEARLRQRIVHSPIDGYVAERLHRGGESVDELQPVVKIVRLDPMWVEFDCPITDAGLFPKGGESRVRLASDKTVVARARVVFASETADAASQTFRVRLQLESRRRFKTGLKVFVEFAGQ
jgi:RND family efflux transporter MFP subunit